MFKKIILASFLSALFFSTAFASARVGLGGQIGMYTPINNVNSYLINKKKFDGRLYVDYSFFKNFSTQLGYTYYSNYAYKNGFKNTDGTKLQGFDLVGVVKVPVIYNFDLYAKGGVNYIFTPSEFKKLTGLAGIGVAYNFTENFSGNIEAVRSFKNGILPKIDNYSIGVKYSFDI